MLQHLVSADSFLYLTPFLSVLLAFPWLHSVEYFCTLITGLLVSCWNSLPHFYYISLPVWKSVQNPLLDGWYWAVLMCRIPFALQKSSNSLEINWGPLSLTIVAGSPFLENIVLKTFTVYVDVVVVILTTSGHFKWEFTFIKNMASKKGPAKSMWTLSYGFVGHSHAFSGAPFGAFWFCWHFWHLLATVSISWSIPGQQQKLLTSVFTCILTTPRCHSWIWDSNWSLGLVGIFTRTSQIIHPWCMDSSLRGV